MSELFKGIQNLRTTYGAKPEMIKYKSSGDPVLDLYFKVGGARGRFNIIKDNLLFAFLVDPVLTLRLLLWLRDAREGAGERELFRQSILELAKYEEFYKHSFHERVLSMVAVLGRWDDLVFLAEASPKLRNAAVALLYHALFLKGDRLAAKWMPRKGMIFNILANHPEKKLGLRNFRKHLVRLTEVVETKMCANQWKNINYSHVPSLAAARYQRAFARHDPIGYATYREGLKKGTEKINAGAVYPYDVVKSLFAGGDPAVAQAQWEALPDYMEGTEHKGILPIIDTSGSMFAARIPRSNLCAADVAVSLGLYLAEKNKGIFKDGWLTFSTKPSLQYARGTLAEKIRGLDRTNWANSTDLMAAFSLILNTAIRGGLPKEEMPQTILIISDMAFNGHVRITGDAMAQIRDAYKRAGYPVPKVVFWNVYYSGNVPATENEFGVVLVSGFSPAVMKGVLANSNSPREAMLKVILSDRYLF